MSIQRILLFAAFIAFAISCSEDNFQSQSSPEPQYAHVDQRLWSYYKEFENEAKLRGYSYDLNSLEITGSIEHIPEQGVAGVCQYGSHIHDVTIDLDFWNNSNDRLKEFVVFHELGHCVLSRGHDESQFSNGLCKSIMRSGLGNCEDAYSLGNRNYYLNELFGNF